MAPTGITTSPDTQNALESADPYTFDRWMELANEAASVALLLRREGRTAQAASWERDAKAYVQCAINVNDRAEKHVNSFPPPGDVLAAPMGVE